MNTGKQLAPASLRTVIEYGSSIYFEELTCNNSCSVGAEMQHSSVEIKVITSLDQADQIRYVDSLA